MQIKELNSWRKSGFRNIVWFQVSQETVSDFSPQATGMLKKA